MEGNVRKFIIIPEHRPLWALGAAFGPKHGPLERPCPVTLDIIGRLLKQSGNEAVTIYEMVKMPDGKFSTPVQLTLDNYTLPYERIVKGETINVNGTSVSDATPPNSMKPNIISSGESKKEADPPTPSSPKAMFSQLAAESEAENKAALASQIVTTPPAEPEKSDDVEMNETPSTTVAEEPAAPEADPPTEETTESSEPEAPAEEETPETDVQMDADPYAGMTKAERKAARRAERQAAAQASAQASEE